MTKAQKLSTIFTLGLACCFVLVSLAQAQVSENFIKSHVKNKEWAVSLPIWQIVKDGTATNVNWVSYSANKRFAVWNADTPLDETDDLVLDKETGLVWARDAGGVGQSHWWNAINAAAHFEDGNRAGWRLPTRDELLSLVDPGNAGGAREALPTDHPFLNVQIGDAQTPVYYWTQTTCEDNSAYAWVVDLESGDPSCSAGPAQKAEGPAYIWPVRGGNGYASGNW